MTSLHELTLSLSLSLCAWMMFAHQVLMADWRLTHPFNITMTRRVQPLSVQHFHRTLSEQVLLSLMSL